MRRDVEIAVKHNVNDLFERVKLEADASEHLDVQPYSYWKSVFKLFIKNKGAIVCAVLLIIIVSMSIIIPALHPDFQPFMIVAGPRFQKPSWQNPFGTNLDNVSIWLLTWVGTQLSLKLAIVVAAINVTLGIIIGSIWGYFRKIDRIMIEIRNFVTNVPTLLLYMILLYVLPPSFWTLVFAMCLFGWMGLASFIRNQILVIDNREYNIASKTLGTPPSRMIVHNLLPYLVSVIVTVVARVIPGVIITESSLTYFGLGFNPSVSVTLGTVMQNGYAYFMDFPYVLFYPALIAGMLTLCFYVIGFALADATDPKNHR